MNSNWLPPDTAPKDGTEILGFGRSVWGGPVESDQVYSFRVVRWTKGEWATSTDNPYEDIMDLEWWMPLPKAPQNRLGEK